MRTATSKSPRTSPHSRLPDVTKPRGDVPPSSPYHSPTPSNAQSSNKDDQSQLAASAARGEQSKRPLSDMQGARRGSPVREQEGVAGLERMRRRMSAQLASGGKQNKSSKDASPELSQNLELPEMRNTERSLSSETENLSPLLTGSQTVSSESNQTIRDNAGAGTPLRYHASTPSYPFPHMRSALGTPFRTSNAALQGSFMALSPTARPATRQPEKLGRPEPPPYFAATRKDDINVLSASLPPQPYEMGETVLGEAPNLYEIALSLQSEPDLESWWTNVTKVFRENYGAERLSLAVPSDSTDAENVPWAQIATYRPGNDDLLSQVNNEPVSGKSSEWEVHSQEESKGEQGTEPRPGSIQAGLGNKVGAPPRASRPKLESRHSFAGFVHAQTFGHSGKTQAKPTAPRPSVSRMSSHTTLQSGQPTEVNFSSGVRLSAESLRRHEAIEALRSPLSEDMYLPSQPDLGRILNVLQPLETEADPLLTTAGVSRVIDRSKIIILTREFSDGSRSSDSKVPQRRSPVSGDSIWPNPNSKLASMPPKLSELSQKQLASLKGSPLLSMKRPTSLRSASSKGSSQSRDEIGNSPLEILQTVPYDDYEQVPASPWAQSPAPSPAIQNDVNANPFFVQNAVDEDTFPDSPPAHDYTTDRNIEAIGVDSAVSLIHVPLIHPIISRNRRPQRLRADAGKRNHRGLTGDLHSSTVTKNFSLDFSESEKRTPIAILSIIASTVPYSPALTGSLGDLAPLLATSFYNARQHWNLQKANDGLSCRRKLGLQSGISDRHNLNVAEKTSSGTMGSESPPANSGSTASASEKSAMSLHSSRASFAGASLTSTPGKDQPETSSPEDLLSETDDSSMRQRSRRDLTYEDKILENDTNEASLFSKASKRHISPFRRVGSPEAPRKQSPHRFSNQPEESPAKTQKTLHTLGADFKATHPSLPSDAAIFPLSGQSVETMNMLGEPNYIFEEPTLAMLKIMINIGATQQFIANAQTGAIVWANSKFQTYRNESALEIHHYPWSHVHKDDRKNFRKIWRAAFNTGQQVSHQVRLRRFDGQFRWFHIRILPLQDKHAVVRHWHGQAMDIHDQHVAEVDAAREKEKAASESKYRSLANSNPHIILAASVPNGLTFANSQWLSYSGQSLEDALGFGFLQQVHPDDISKCHFPTFGSPHDPRSPKSTQSLRAVSSRKDSVSSSPATSEATAVPKNKSKVDENAPDLSLAGTKATNDVLVDLIRNGVIKCSKDGQGRLSVSTEMRLRSRSDEYRWHLVQGSLIESVDFGQGEAQWIIACADISYQKQNEEQLRDACATLEKETSRKMEYLSSMSHEIRTPLNGIIGNLQFLLNSALDDHQSEWTYAANSAAQGMHSLINDILDVSKAEAKMLKLFFGWFQVRPLLESVIETVNAKAAEKGLEVCYELAEDVPLAVKGDAGRIKQVLLNLVGNAVKFTKHGEIWVKCEVMANENASTAQQELDTGETFLRFTVKDTGPGFTEEERKLLFKPYSQIDNSSTRGTGGTGLGLILCKNMVELHGGEIDARGIPGKGSEFSFYARFNTRDLTGKSSGASSIILDSPLQSASIAVPDAPNKNLVFREHMTESPGITTTGTNQDSPAVQSSGSSAPSINSLSQWRSMRSSVSTVDSSVNLEPIKLALPSVASQGSSALRSDTSVETVKLASSPHRESVDHRNESGASAGPVRESLHPPMLSILIVCPQENTRRTTQDHIQRILPKSTPSQITTNGDVSASQKMITGDNPITFSHVVLQLHSVAQILPFMDQILNSSLHPRTCIVLVTDQAQQAAVTTGAPNFDYDQLSVNQRLIFLLKPAKPHKFAKIFDPAQENALSKDDQSRADAREKTKLQREAFKHFKQVLGYKGIRVLAVEDNAVNMQVCIMVLVDTILGLT